MNRNFLALVCFITPIFLSGCVTTTEPLFGFSEQSYQPVSIGYSQSCLIHNLQVSDCDVFKLEALGASTALLSGPGDAKPSTVAFERIDDTYFIAQFSLDAKFAYALGRKTPEGQVSFSQPNCKAVLAARQKFATDGVELDPTSTDSNCRPRQIDAKTMKNFFRTYAAISSTTSQPIFHLRNLSKEEGMVLFEKAVKIKAATAGGK